MAVTTFPLARRISVISWCAVPSLCIMSRASWRAGGYKVSKLSRRHAAGLESASTAYWDSWCSWYSL